MFDLSEEKTVDEYDGKEPCLKKKKVDKLYESTFIHSSLEYTSIRAPPRVAYKSIDSYCENNRGQSLLYSEKRPSTSGLRDLQSVSSPIILETPKEQSVKQILSEEAMPHTLFTVEELSLVNTLKHWTNLKVSAVGQLSLDTTNQKCYLNSVQESGHYALLLDTSLLAEIPTLQQLLQIFGTLTINGVEPCIIVYFTRNLSWVHLSLFHDSYRLMQKHMGTIDFFRTEKKSECILKSPQKIGDFEMNDTLDDFSFVL